MKIYIAGPMDGYEEYNFSMFNEAAEILRGAGHDIFNPAEVMEKTTRQFFAIELSWICLHAEAICMLEGWENSRGATIEHLLAKRLNLQIFYMDMDKLRAKGGCS